jgi:hypothetical protein
MYEKEIGYIECVTVGQITMVSIGLSIIIIRALKYLGRTTSAP